ncbi:MAG: phosphatidylserine/phosphatidylglycerophosphate/cardiolipin synthase family protein [Candidatus Sericytochromatia bacterium]|nr:phosphatidylserine/phosphatidylglycerophosphate/cardiolipin synthase family protein [Candidatus Sericytochromatia bacterium]
MLVKKIFLLSLASLLVVSCGDNSINSTKSSLINTYTISNQNKVDLFVDGSEIFPEIFKTIDNAKKKIYVTTYLFGESIGHKIAEKLIEKKKQGLQVEFIADGTLGTLSDLVEPAKKELNYMIQNGVEVRIFPVDLMPKGPTFLSNKKLITHAKIVLADDQVAMVGGMNFKDSEAINHDYMLRIEGDAAKDLSKMSDLDWSKSRPMSKSTQSLNTKGISIDNTNVDVAQTGFFEQTITAMMLNNINNAKKSIIIEMLLIDHQDIVKALVDAKNRGVDIRIIVDQVDVGKYNKFLEELPIQGMANFGTVLTLNDANIPIKWYIPQQKDQMLHAKTMLIDDETFITGSANFTYHALTRNHEISVAVKNVNVATRYKQIFEQDWNSNSKVAELTTTQRFIGKLFQKFGKWVYGKTESEIISQVPGLSSLLKTNKSDLAK